MTNPATFRKRYPAMVLGLMAMIVLNVAALAFLSAEWWAQTLNVVALLGLSYSLGYVRAVGYVTKGSTRA